MSPDSHRPSADRTRRRFLAGGGAALAASFSALTAGCLSGLPPLGDRQRYGRLSPPQADDPAYRKWLPAPSSVEPLPRPYHFASLRPSISRSDAPERFVARRAHAKADLDYFGIGFENYDRLVDSSFGTVVEATFDRSSVVRTVTESGYERAGEYRGYAVFARSDVPRRVAVGDEFVAWTSAYRHDSPNLEALVDAGDGELPRYHETNDAFGLLSTAAGGNPYLGFNAAVGDPTGRPAMLADALRFGDDAAYQIVHYRYDADRVPTTRALEAALKRDGYRFADGAESFDVGIDGRLATVEARVPLRSGGDLDPEYDLPQVTWGATHDESDESVTFRHEAGESVPSRRLFYDVDTPSVPGRIDKRPLWFDVDVVEAGVEATVDLSERPDASSVNLVYSTGGIRYRVLFGLDLRGDADG